MSSIFKVGQVLTGKLARYIVTKEIQETVWFAQNYASQESVVIKSVRNHPRVENERDILRRFQGRTPYLRPVIDEIEDPAEPVTIVLKYLDDNLQYASNKQTLSRKELMFVSKRILQALSILHDDGFVHTGRFSLYYKPKSYSLTFKIDVKLDNVLVNYGQGDVRFTDVQLSDCGGTYHIDHKYAKECSIIGAPIWRSPEAVLQLPVGWTTATDIWSFGLCLIALIYGGNFHIQAPPGTPFGSDEYELKILERQFKLFGPFPAKYQDLVQDNENIQTIVVHLYDSIPSKDRNQFSRISQKEMSRRDKEFVGKIMKMDPRDRPTARELLEDNWFDEVEE